MDCVVTLELCCLMDFPAFGEVSYRPKVGTEALEVDAQEVTLTALSVFGSKQPVLPFQTEFTLSIWLSI